MNPNDFLQAYIRKNLLSSQQGPETAAILKVGTPEGEGFVYDPVRKDYDRILDDEVVVPIGIYGSGENTFHTGKPRRAGSTGMPWYRGGVPIDDLKGYSGNPEMWKEMGVPEDVINELLPNRAPAYINEGNKYAAEIIDNYNRTGEPSLSILGGQ